MDSYQKVKDPAQDNQHRELCQTNPMIVNRHEDKNIFIQNK